MFFGRHRLVDDVFDDAAKAGMEQLAYNADADKDSWDRMLKLFAEVFGPAKPAAD